MRTINTSLVQEYADKIRTDLPLAKRAYGSQPPGSPAREASLRVNAALVDFVDEHSGNVTHLAAELEGDISLPGLRRRLRVGRAQRAGVSLPVKAGRGSRDPVRVAQAARAIENARGVSSGAYGAAVREAYSDGISLKAIADELGVSYFSAWTAASSGV